MDSAAACWVIGFFIRGATLPAWARSTAVTTWTSSTAASRTRSQAPLDSIRLSTARNDDIASFGRKTAGTPPRGAASMAKTTRKKPCLPQPHLRTASLRPRYRGRSTAERPTSEVPPFNAEKQRATWTKQLCLLTLNQVDVESSRSAYLYRAQASHFWSVSNSDRTREHTRIL